MTQDPYEILGNVLSYGATRYEDRAEKLLIKWDVFFRIDPQIGIEERKTQTAERLALWQIDHRGTCDHMVFLHGLKALLQKGEIRQKTRGGWTITKSGRQRLKASDKRVCDIIRGHKS